MVAFDADVLSEILRGRAMYAERAAKIPIQDQAVPVVVLEEIFRGRLNTIRRAEAGTSRTTLEQAYDQFQDDVARLRWLRFLRFDAGADTKFREFRAARMRAGTHDLRIASICIVHSAKLVTRNRRDFEDIPGLDVEFWA